MDCPAFERWLSEGRPEAERPAARAHAAGCTACAAREVAAADVERLLAQRFATAPAGFSTRVMARLPAPSPPPQPEIPDPFPLFVRMLLEPSTVLGLVLALAYAWWGAELWSSGAEVVAGLVEAGRPGLDSLPPWAAGLVPALLAAATLGGGSWLLYRLADAVGTRAARPTTR